MDDIATRESEGGVGGSAINPKADILRTSIEQTNANAAEPVKATPTKGHEEDGTVPRHAHFATPVNMAHKILCDSEDCAICLNPLDNFEPTIVTRCKHTFHRACLLQTKSLCKSECPMCRQKLTPPSNNALRLGAHNDAVSEDGLSAISDLSSRMAIAAAARRGRNAVRQAIQRRQQQHIGNGSPILTSA